MMKWLNWATHLMELDLIKQKKKDDIIDIIISYHLMKNQFININVEYAEFYLMNTMTIKLI